MPHVATAPPELVATASVMAVPFVMVTSPMLMSAMGSLTVNVIVVVAEPAELLAQIWNVVAVVRLASNDPEMVPPESDNPLGNVGDISHDRLAASLPTEATQSVNVSPRSTTRLVGEKLMEFGVESTSTVMVVVVEPPGPVWVTVWVVEG